MRMNPLNLFTAKPARLQNHGAEGGSYWRARVGPSVNGMLGVQEQRTEFKGKRFTCLFSKHFLSLQYARGRPRAEEDSCYCPVALHLGQKDQQVWRIMAQRGALRGKRRTLGAQRTRDEKAVGADAQTMSRSLCRHNARQRAAAADNHMLKGLREEEHTPLQEE